MRFFSRGHRSQTDTRMLKPAVIMLVLIICTLCADLLMLFGFGQKYQIINFAEVRDVIEEIPCTFVYFSLLWHYHPQEKVIECGTICNDNIDCAYFLVNNRECVLCEKYAGYVKPGLTSMQISFLDDVPVFTRMLYGELQLYHTALCPYHTYFHTY